MAVGLLIALKVEVVMCEVADSQIGKLNLSFTCR